MSNRTATITIIVIAIVLILLGIGYWWYMSHIATSGTQNGGTGTSQGFSPLNRSGGQNSSTNTNLGSSGKNKGNQQGVIGQTNPIPVLRLLSNTPVGGYMASTTGTTTVMRWIDRGRGDVYQTKNNTLAVETISNTLLPRLYNSLWNAAGNAFIGQTLQDNSETPTSIYAQLQPQTGTSTAFYRSNRNK